MAIFGPKTWVNPFGKNVNFSTFWTSCIYSLERRFNVLEYRKRNFPCWYCLKKLGKMVIFGSKAWVNPLWKNGHFSTFWTSCFYSLRRRFFLLEFPKRHFPGWYCLKRNFGKMVIFGQKPCVNPFGKMAIFNFLNFLFL